MFLITKPLSSAHAKNYHKNEYSHAKENYYLDSPATTTSWHGALADVTFGLTGPVTQLHFERLADGQDPHTGQQLIKLQTPHYQTNKYGVKELTMEHRAGFDGVMSASKSISIAALVGGDARILAAGRESLRETLDALQPVTQARPGGGRPGITTGKWIAAVFEHDSARPVRVAPDRVVVAPQLHWHVVAMNMTVLGDRIKPVEPWQWFRSQSYATAYWRAAMAYRLSALGYQIEQGLHGEPVIVGFSPEYLQAMSPRHAEIQATMRELGLHGRDAAERVARWNRMKKLPLTHETVQAQHQQMAAQYGHQPQRVVQEALDRTAHGIAVTRPSISAREALDYAIAAHFERECVADRRALLTLALQRAMGAQPPAAIEAEYARRIAAHDLIRVQHPAGRPGERVTTPELFQLERNTLVRMRAALGTQQALVPAAAITAPTLSPHQRAALDAICANTDRVQVLEGRAGTGKTTLLAALAPLVEATGRVVEGFAPTSGATRELSKVGITSQTLQGALLRPLPTDGRPRLWILDESSLTSVRQMERLITRIAPTDRLLLVGNVRQHEAVEAGRPYAQLQAAGATVTTLTEIIRQKPPELVRVATDLSLGQTRDALDALVTQGRVHQIPSGLKRAEQIAQEYARDPDTLVIAPENARRMALNERIHTRLQDLGRVGQHARDVPLLIPRQDLTGADRKWVTAYAVGNVLRYVKRSAEFQPSTYATVTRLDQQAHTLTVRTDDGRDVTYDPSRRFSGVTVYEAVTRALAVGDTVQTTAPDKTRKLANRARLTVMRIDPQTGGIDLALKSGRVVTFSATERKHLDYGYAMTSYSSEGSSASRTIIDITTTKGSPAVNWRTFYVAVTRCINDVQLYTDDEAQLLRALSRDVTKTQALSPTLTAAPTQVLDAELARRSPTFQP